TVVLAGLVLTGVWLNHQLRQERELAMAHEAARKMQAEEAFANAKWARFQLAHTNASGVSPLDLLDPAAIPPEERFASQPPELVAVLRELRDGAGGDFRALALSPDGAFVACRTENAVRLRDAATLRQRAEFTHPRAFFSLAFSPDSRTLATAGGGEA